MNPSPVIVPKSSIGILGNPSRSCILSISDDAVIASCVQQSWVRKSSAGLGSLFGFGLVFILLINCCISTRAAVVSIDFQDAQGIGDGNDANNVIPSNFKGLQWENWYADSFTWPGVRGNAIAPTTMLFNNLGYVVPSIKFGQLVNFISITWTGYQADQWIEGYVAGVKVFESDHTWQTLYEFNTGWSYPVPFYFFDRGFDWKVDELRFYSTGLQAGNRNGFYLIDDLTYDTSVPEAVDVGLLLVSVFFFVILGRLLRTQGLQGETMESGRCSLPKQPVPLR
jgi:hypothetical protein